MRTRRFGIGFATLALALALTGCFNPFAPRIASVRGVSEPAPYPNSPRNALLLFQWCWNHRNIDSYREIFTDDFRFAFALTDSTGIPYLTRGWTREDEIESTKHLFVSGGPGQPTANHIILDFDATLTTYPDSRPGKIDPWHKEITTRVDLSVSISDGGGWRSNGSARFYFVRGDSAVIPRELSNQGFLADSNRWFIERYEEEVPSTIVTGPTWLEARVLSAPPKTGGHSGLDADLESTTYVAPWRSVTWGRLKRIYR